MKKIAITPIKLRQDFEVHPANTCDKRGWKEDDINDGKDFDDFILLNAQNTDEDILQIIQPFKIKLSVVNQGL